MQRQLRLGDILDDYCPRERRLTNHAIVAMIGEDVKQTRCTTCDAEHEYKHARVPRQRQKETPAALKPQAVPSGPKRVAGDAARLSEGVALQGSDESGPGPQVTAPAEAQRADAFHAEVLRAEAEQTLGSAQSNEGPRLELERMPREVSDDGEGVGDTEGPAHRRLIRATLPRLEGQPPAPRPAPDFTIRTPATGRPGRFRARPGRGGGGQPLAGNRNSSSGNVSRGGQRGGNARSPLASHQSRRFDGRKRSK